MDKSNTYLGKSLVSEGLRFYEKPKKVKPDNSLFTVDLSRSIIVCNQCKQTTHLPEDEKKRNLIKTEFKEQHSNCGEH